MKNLSLALLVIIAGTVAYSSLPLTSVAILTVTVFDQNGEMITADADATYFDENGDSIVDITFRSSGSWDNNLHWWSHSSHSRSIMRPEDAMRATTVRIKVKDCDEKVIAVNLDRSYEALSLAPHGGGKAYFIYRFDRSVVLQCKKSIPTLVLSSAPPV